MALLNRHQQHLAQERLGQFAQLGQRGVGGVGRGRLQPPDGRRERLAQAIEHGLKALFGGGLGGNGRLLGGFYVHDFQHQVEGLPDPARPPDDDVLGGEELSQLHGRGGLDQAAQGDLMFIGDLLDLVAIDHRYVRQRGNQDVELIGQAPGR